MDIEEKIKEQLIDEGYIFNNMKIEYLFTDNRNIVYKARLFNDDEPFIDVLTPVNKKTIEQEIKEKLINKGYVFDEIEIIHLPNLNIYSVALVKDGEVMVIYMDDNLKITKTVKPFELYKWKTEDILKWKMTEL